MALLITAVSSETKGTVCLTPRDFLWSLLCVQCFISTLIEPLYISSPYPAAQVTWIRTWALNLIISLPWSLISLPTLRLNFPAHHESNQNTGKTFFFSFFLWMKGYQYLIFFPVSQILPFFSREYFLANLYCSSGARVQRVNVWWE